MKYLPKILIPCLALLVVSSNGFAAKSLANGPLLTWEQLPQLPDKNGFAGSFVGVSNGALIVAGGANFPDKPPWEGGKKIWHDRIFVLENPNGKWHVAKQKLPRPLAYGVSVSRGGLICIGGGDANKHYRDVFRLSWSDGEIVRDQLPPLPSACAFGCGVKLRDTIYVAGGIEKPSSTKAMHSFWALDLSQRPNKRKWQRLKPWPGPERLLAVAGAARDSVYVFSGVQLTPDKHGQPKRVLPFLSDAYRFDTNAEKWKKLAASPRAVAAGPSPAPVDGANIILLGGVDGSLFHVEQQKHPGFTRAVLSYDAKADKWLKLAAMPAGSSRVTVPTAFWRGSWVIVSGEARPGVRSPKVFSITLGGAR